jgi:RNA polymerase sigma-70 factor (ECF subfamily)
VARLPPQQRLVVELRVFEELPFRAVAEVADCSEDSAKVNFHHALKRLRALMNEEEAT